MVLSRARALLSFILLAVLSATVLADPPSRVARLSHVNGNASFSPAGEREWWRAILNRPLTTGDRLWVERDSRAELQMGAVAVRAAGGTNLTLLNLDDRITQVQLTRGTLHVRVRRLDRGEVVEINTPNLAFSIRRPGSYRIDVNQREDVTTVAVLQGRAQVFGDRRAFVVGERQSFAFYGGGLDDIETVALGRPDEFDRWVAARERRWETSPSRRFVSPEMIGFADLDEHGTWRNVPQIGNVWVPRRVSADWAPYRDGHWSWIEPWGWTWIDDAPWGFAPSHYGRWMRLDNRWAWVPGPANTRPVYAPAVVAFVGDGSPGANATVAWFPLGPRDVYRPSYTTSRDYFVSLNASNARVDRQVISAQFDNRGAGVTYTNRQVPGAIVAMPAAAFSQSQPVARVTIRIGDQGLRGGAVLAAPPVVPRRESLAGAAAAASARPPEAAPARPVVAQVAPPPPRPAFAARQRALEANAGKPLDAAAVAAIQPAAPASAAAVKVVPDTQAVDVPKTAASASPASTERRNRRQRGDDSRDAPAPAAPASAPAAAAPAATPATPAAPARPAAPASAAAPATPAVPATPAAPASRATPAAPAVPATPAAPATRPGPAASAAAAPASADAGPGAQGRQRAREAREERDQRRSGRDRTEGSGPGASSGRPAPDAPAAGAPPAADAPAAAASRPGPRAGRARGPASAASAPGTPASASR